ncbi:hypothetical protein Acr_00g0082730 [Actinidia rufa]|uniref:Uncharacterized protein n=1 Tax=Actinidia rufa TaxID=165716 RepID=A0A7J0DV02_9ERIC|nr:hypothetical protein Acr_00g0082730 [Actinidia rufa]
MCPSCLWSSLSPTTVVSPLYAGGASLFDTARLNLVPRDVFSPVLTICLYFQGMSLNRAQILVCDSEALAQFRVGHRIPDDVVIERPGPNDDADWVEGEGNRMPIRIWFIYQAGLRFSLSKLLRTVLSLCGLTFMQISVNFVRTVLAVEALMRREELEFTAEDLLHRLLKEAEGESSGSSESSFSSWDVDLGDERLDEEAEREGQAPRIEPPMLPEASDSSMSVPTKDQSIMPSSMAGGKHKGKQPAEGTSQQKRGKVMLPQDVADHAAETTAEFGGKLVVLGAQASAFVLLWAISSSLRLKQGAVDLKKAYQRANSLKKELKQTKSKLADARCSTVPLSELDMYTKGNSPSSALVFFQEGWLACLKELKIPLDHPAWSSPAPPIQLFASLERYSPINLPDFNEEEYAILLADEGNINTAVAEARTVVEEMVDGDRAREAEGDRAVEAEGENLV